ncbi:MAG: FKBP-type peptidyl-prolyl cis-trans isomerase [Firmicutes bacterium]|nr:FKBP-type peptidyl-prolyl cis-trans isomerase [Bacillota bacterium]
MKKVIGLLLVLILTMGLLAGCVEPEPRPENGETAAESASEQEASAQTAETSEASEGTSEGVTSEESAEESEWVYEPFDYSSGLDENGFFKGITALNYVELCDYLNIRIPKEEIAATQEEIQAEIDDILAAYQTTAPVMDRAVQDGDTVNIDYVGYLDGVAFDGGNTMGMGTTVTIGVTNYIPGFLDQLIGHMPGEQFDINVTFPENYGNTDLAGKDAVFNIMINYIEETITPELTDEFVLEHLQEEELELGSAEELKAYIVSQIEEDKIRTYINQYISENSTYKAAPGSLISYMSNMMLDYYAYYANMYGLDVDTFVQQYVGYMSAETLIQSYTEQILEDANATLLLQAIAEDAGIEVTEDDIRSYFEDVTGSPDYSAYEEEYGLPYIKQAVLFSKVQDFLFEHVIVE